MRTWENSVQEITLKFRKYGLLSKGEVDGKDGWMLAMFFFDVSPNTRKKGSHYPSILNDQPWSTKNLLVRQQTAKDKDNLLIKAKTINSTQSYLKILK